MARINDHYLKLKAGYLFPEIARRVSSFAEAHHDARIIKLGIGDVTEPLPPVCIEAMHQAVDEMGTAKSFRGYGPEQGYAFLRSRIAQCDYQARGCDISADEIFVSDGSKCDTGNILDILAVDNQVAVTDPVYPVYVDTNIMAGNTGLIYLPISAENDFIAELPRQKVDVIYLCSPNNPTGAAATRATLTRWVEYAREHDALILFDAAYEAYISDRTIPHSIYEIEGATQVAIEFRSFSKNAGFTGMRCAFTVVPHALTAANSQGERSALHPLWRRRQSTKFNGVCYIVQRGAEAVYSDAGRQQVQKLIAFYMDNAKIVRDTLTSLGLQVYGGRHAPYVWIKTPGSMSSWDFFDKLLNELHVVGTPGSGFGDVGEGYFRLSAFNSRANIHEAMGRCKEKLRI